MDEKERLEKKNAWREKWRWGAVALVTICVSITFYFFFLRFDGFSSAYDKVMATLAPIIIGMIIAYLLNPMVCFYQRNLYKFFSKRMKKEKSAKKLSKALAITISMLIFIVALTLLIWSIVPAIISSVASLTDTLPTQVERFVKSLENYSFEENEIFQYFELTLTNVTDYGKTWVQENLLPQAQNYISTVTSGVYSVAKGILNFIIGIIVAVYVLSIKETLCGQSKKIIYAVFKPKAGNIILKTVRKSSDIFGGFISGKIIDSVIIGVICYFGCLILHIPQPLLIAVIVGVTNVIPVFGPFIGAIPSIFLVVIQSPIHALYLLIFIIVLQQVDGNIIGPKILGNSTGLSTFWVMFAILLGGGLWGFMGMLFGVPVFGVIYYILKEIVAYGVARRKLSTQTRDYIKMDHVDLETNELVYPQKKEEPEKEEEKAQKEVKEEEKSS